MNPQLPTTERHLDVRVHVDQTGPERVGPSTGRLWFLAILVFLAALFIRVADLSSLAKGDLTGITLNGLSAWPFIHDEAIHANFALGIRDWAVGVHNQPRSYDPTYHGPLQYYLVAGAFGINGAVDSFTRLWNLLYAGEIGPFVNDNFWICMSTWATPPAAVSPASAPAGAAEIPPSFWAACAGLLVTLMRNWALHGDTDAAARMPSVIFGAVMCALPLAFVRRIGLSVALAACGLLLFCSPTHSYYSRIVLYDIMCTTVEVAAAACFFQGLSTNRVKWFGWATFFVACDLYLKPTALLFGVMLAVIGFYELVLGPEGIARGQMGAVHRLAWMRTARGWKIFCALVFLGLTGWVLLYSDFGRWPEHRTAIDEMIGHWLSIHDQPRLQGAKWYYLAMMVIYDPLVLFLGIPAAVGLFLFHREPVIRFFSLWTLLSIPMYAWAGEKGPWLINHIIVPATIPTAWIIVWILRAGWEMVRAALDWLRNIPNPLAATVVTPVSLVTAVLGLGLVLAVTTVAGYQAYSTWHLLYVQPAWDGDDPAISVRAQRDLLKKELASLGGNTTIGRLTVENSVIPVLLQPDRWEIMTYVATTRDFARLTQQLLAVINGKKGGPESWRGRVAVVDEPQWPLAWYLRASQVNPGSVSFEMPKDPQNFEFIVVPWYEYDLNKQKEMQTKLGATHYLLDMKIPQRAWWTPRFLSWEGELIPQAAPAGPASERERILQEAGPVGLLAEYFRRANQGTTWETFWGHILHRYAFDWSQAQARDTAAVQVAVLPAATTLAANKLKAAREKGMNLSPAEVEKINLEAVREAYWNSLPWYAKYRYFLWSTDQYKNNLVSCLNKPDDLPRLERAAAPAAPNPGVFFLYTAVWRHKGS